MRVNQVLPLFYDTRITLLLTGVKLQVLALVKNMDFVATGDT
jgi:hypothetical protein